MSKKNTNVSENTSTETKTAPEFTVDELRPKALELFGVTQSTYAGATFGLDGKYTVQKMKDHIDKWLKKEVK